MLHVMPIDDTEEHVYNANCHCGARQDLTNDGDVFVIHNAFDNRHVLEELVDGTDVHVNSKGWAVYEI